MRTIVIPAKAGIHLNPEDSALLIIVFLFTHANVHSMIKVNISDLKNHFSKYLRKVVTGADVVICKNGTPIAKIIPLPSKRQKNK